MPASNRIYRHLPSKRIDGWDLGDLMHRPSRSHSRPYVKAARRAEKRAAMKEALQELVR